LDNLQGKAQRRTHGKSLPYILLTTEIDFANVVLLENETKVMAHNRVIKEAYAALTDEEKAAYSTEASLKVEKKIKESTEDVKFDFEKRPARIKQLRTTLMTTMARLANEVGVEVIGFWIDPYSSDTTGISIESFGPKALYDLLPTLDKTEVKKIFKENQPKSTQLERVYVTEGRKVPVTRPPLYPNESDFAKHVSRQDQLLSFVRNHFHYRYDLLMRKLAGTGPKKREYLFPWGKFSQGRKSGDPIGNDQIAVLGWPEDIIFPSKSDSLPMQNCKYN
jgi:predicted ribosome quality control (RQC) complex YloA/Tae2 family protein